MNRYHVTVTTVQWPSEGELCICVYRRGRHDVFL